jgi:hypothetical protein
VGNAINTCCVAADETIRDTEVRDVSSLSMQTWPNGKGSLGSLGPLATTWLQ